MDLTALHLFRKLQKRVILSLAEARLWAPLEEVTPWLPQQGSKHGLSQGKIKQKRHSNVPTVQVWINKYSLYDSTNRTAKEKQYFNFQRRSIKNKTKKKKLAENMQFALKSSYKLKRTQSSWKE